MCKWAWRKLSCQPSSCRLTHPLARGRTGKRFAWCEPKDFPSPPVPVVSSPQSSPFSLDRPLILLLAVVAVWLGSKRRATRTKEPGLLTTVYRMVVCRGGRRPGLHTGLRFPIRVDDVVGPDGPAHMTAMLQHGGHLPLDSAVTSVRRLDGGIRDGVKGQKAVVAVEYNAELEGLPRRYFVKFNLPSLSPMRLLVEASEVCACEAFYYNALQREACVASPRCYFADTNVETGEFVMLSDVVDFGAAGTGVEEPRGPPSTPRAPSLAAFPLKHRVRDEPRMEDLRLLVARGAALNAQWWGGAEAALDGFPRFERTHRRLWTLMQLTARAAGLHHTTARTLKGKALNRGFMTWEVPVDLIGREDELVSDMPLIMASLAEISELVAYGHNDVVLDNAYFFLDSAGRLDLGFFDWQQACLNNVGQEWAWNWHFL